MLNNISLLCRKKGWTLPDAVDTAEVSISTAIFSFLVSSPLPGVESSISEAQVNIWILIVS